MAQRLNGSTVHGKEGGKRGEWEIEQIPSGRNRVGKNMTELLTFTDKLP